MSTPTATEPDRSTATHTSATRTSGDGASALALRARRIRRRAALVNDPVLRPLVVAMRRRAAELELESAVRAARWA
ncbi:MAG: hypothetical protein KDB21_00790 [Acidimicrobiales bacterium]|nr:hypothetical protein [Acidimicrobiales bacterium]